MKKSLLLSLVLLYFNTILYSQNTYTKSWDITFSGGNNGSFAGLDPSDVAVTFNSTEGTMQVEVNKLIYTWSYLNIYMEACYAKRIVFDQSNRYIEFRIKSSVAVNDVNVNPKGGNDGACPKSVGKTWTVPKFSITEDEVNQWKIVLLEFAPTIGGYQNILDTMDSRLTWNLPNGSYTFDYVKIGEAAVPSPPVMDQQKNKTYNECSVQQSLTISGIDIPNRPLDGLTISSEIDQEGLIKDLGFVDLDGNGKYIDDTSKTATLLFTPMVGSAGKYGTITVTLSDTIRKTQTTMSFNVNFLYSCCTTLSNYSDQIINNIYPSIVHSDLTIEFSEAFSGKLSIIDMFGNTCIEQTINSMPNASLNLSGLASGIYMLCINNGTNTICKKVLKE